MTNAVNVAQLGSAPAFYAYKTGDQSVGSGSWTKVSLQNEAFDTNNNFDSTTNYRFTPTVAGYYQLNGQICFYSSSGSLTRAIIGIRKNGSTIYNGCDFGATASNSQWQGVISLILYFNGTTDYVEMVGFMSGTGLVFAGGSVGDVSYLNGTLVRAA